MAENAKKIGWEIILILASVLVFRSSWTLLDMSRILSETPGLVIMLFTGIIVSAIAFYRIHSCK